jgi:hypothetical protein
LEWKTGISGFGTSIFWIPEYERPRIVAASHREGPKHESPKATNGHGEAAISFSISEINFLAVLRSRSRALDIETPKVRKHDVLLEWGCGLRFRPFQHFGVRHFRDPEDKEWGTEC